MWNYTKNGKTTTFYMSAITFFYAMFWTEEERI